MVCLQKSKQRSAAINNYCHWEDNSDGFFHEGLLSVQNSKRIFNICS